MDRGLLLLVSMLFLLVTGILGLLAGLAITVGAALAGSLVDVVVGCLIMTLSGAGHRFAYSWFIAAA